MPISIRRIWGITRQVLSVRGLLMWLRWWDPLIAAAGSILVTSWANIERLPKSILAVLFLVTFAVTLIALIILKRFRAEQATESYYKLADMDDDRTKKPTTDRSITFGDNASNVNATTGDYSPIHHYERAPDRHLTPAQHHIIASNPKFVLYKDQWVMVSASDHEEMVLAEEIATALRSAGLDKAAASPGISFPPPTPGIHIACGENKKSLAMEIGTAFLSAGLVPHGTVIGLTRGPEDMIITIGPKP